MYGFSLWPFTLNSWLSLDDLIVMAPCGETCVISKGPDHLDLSFPGNNLSRELKRRTCCPGCSFRSRSLFCPAASQSMFTVLIAQIIGHLSEGLASIIQIAALLLLLYSRRSVLRRVLNGIAPEFGGVHLRECIV
ncbi:hypothetical protein V6N13_124234 [Hibiscus sabdariffa]